MGRENLTPWAFCYRMPQGPFLFPSCSRSFASLGWNIHILLISIYISLPSPLGNAVKIISWFPEAIKVWMGNSIQTRCSGCWFRGWLIPELCHLWPLVGCTFLERADLQSGILLGSWFLLKKPGGFCTAWVDVSLVALPRTGCTEDYH